MGPGKYTFDDFAGHSSLGDRHVGKSLKMDILAKAQWVDS